MKKNWKSGPGVQGAIRKKERMEKFLEKGDFQKALGGNQFLFALLEESFFPRPAFFMPDGARVWSF